MSVPGENSHPCSVRFLKVIQFCAYDDHIDIQFFKLTALMSLQHIQLEGYSSILEKTGINTELSTVSRFTKSLNFS